MEPVSSGVEHGRADAHGGDLAPSMVSVQRHTVLLLPRLFPFPSTH